MDVKDVHQFELVLEDFCSCSGKEKCLVNCCALTVGSVCSINERNND